MPQGRPAPTERQRIVPPNGTVSFLFTDIEGSTGRWERAPEAMSAAVRLHDELLRAAMEWHRGHIFKTMGDAFYAAFPTVEQAAGAAHHAQTSLAAQDFSAVDGLRVRMAIHVGAAELRDGDYFGPVLNKLARMLHAGHGDQVLLSASAAALLTNTLEGGYAVQPLGEHRLKDLLAPEPIYQLTAPGLRAEFPPLRTLNERPHNLPLALTSFVGRDAELQTLRERLSEVRLLTLLGTGGVGKTRLALQIGSEVLNRFAAGVWFIDLAPLASGSLVAGEAASTVGVKVAAEQPAEAALVEFFRERSALLIFDNCEHMVDSVAQLVSAILQRCPGVRVIATSRQALDIAGETIHAVATLDVPPAAVRTAAEAAGYGSVQLFVERARAQRDSFVLDDGNAAIVVEICTRLDGIALALELAAARVAMLSPRALLDRLNDRFRLLAQGSRAALGRQQTLRSLIDWSYDLLDERERRIFRWLSVFSGGWTLEAAAAVCSSAGYDDWDVLELCSSLVAKSLVTANVGAEVQRYSFLESISEYATECLTQSKEAIEAQARHAGYYAEFLEAISPRAERDGDDVAWKLAVEPEVDNLRVALAWSAANEKSLHIRILAGLARPHLVLQTPEALSLFASGASMLSEQTPPLFASLILRRLTRLKRRAGHSVPDQEDVSLRSVAAALASGDPDELILALIERAMLLQLQGRLGDADATFKKADTARTGAQPRTLRLLLVSWGINDLERGDIERARDRFAQNAQLEVAGSEGLAFALMNLAEAEFALNNVDAAQAAAHRARENLQTLGHSALANVDCNLAAYAMAQGDLQATRTYLGEALALLRDAGTEASLTTALEHYASLAALCAQNGMAASNARLYRQPIHQ